MAQLNKSLAQSEAETDHVFADNATRTKIIKHLSDINDTISDEDIRNVITDISSGPADTDKSTLNNIPGEDAIAPDEEAKQLPTSWNVIE